MNPQFDRELVANYAKTIILHNQIKLAFFKSDEIYKLELTKLFEKNKIEPEIFWKEIDAIKVNVLEWKIFLDETKIAIDSLNKL